MTAPNRIRDFDPATNAIIRSIIDRNYQRTRDLLVANDDKLHVMAEALMRFETPDIDQISDIMMDRPVRPPEESGNTSGGIGSENRRKPACLPATEEVP